MEALMPASVVIIVGLAFQIAALLILCVMLVRDRAEGRRVTRELEALLARSLDETAPPIEPSAS